MKILKSEISSGSQTTKLAEALTQEAADAAELINALNSLSCVLQTTDSQTGLIFDKVKAKIDNYITILNQRKNTAENLAQAISSGANTMVAFMEDEIEIDTGDKDEIKATLNRAKADLDTLSIWERTAWQKAKLENPGINPFQKINWILQQKRQNEELIREAEKDLAKIEQLPSIDSQAYSPISSLQSSITTYKSSVNSVTPSDLGDIPVPEIPKNL